MRLKEIAVLTPYSAQKEIIKELAVKAKLPVTFLYFFLNSIFVVNH